MAEAVRTRLLVAVAAVLSAALVVGVTVLQADGGESAEEPGRTAREAPPLELGLGIREDALARELRAAERAFDRGRRDAARARFDELATEHPGSVEAAVGAAVASWPEGTIERLEELTEEHPTSGLVRLHLGLALFAAGEDEAAAREWRAAEEREPDTLTALRAEDLLHPRMAPGRPPFVAQVAPPSGLRGLSPARQLAELERRAQNGEAQDWVLLGIVLQRIGRPVSAEKAFARAAELAPRDLDVRVAAAVGGFDKDEPAQTFSRLGPLADEDPGAGVVRYHLGLALSWIGAVEEARRQLRLASEEAAGSFYGREAKRLLSRLEAVGP